MDSDPKAMGKSGPQFSFSNKPNRNDDTVSPGPGAYTEGLKGNKLGGKIGSEAR